MSSQNKKKASKEVTDQRVKAMADGRAKAKEKREAALKAEQNAADSSPPTAPVDETPTKEAKQPVEEDKLAWMKDRIDIMVHKVEGLPNPLYVGVNGKSFWIELGQWVHVPKAIYNTLVNAVIDTKEYISLPNIPGKYEIRDASNPRFAVSVKV